MRGAIVCCALLASSLVGCAGNIEQAHFGLANPPARDDAHCAALSNRHEFAVDAAWVDGSLAGASGAIAGGLPADVPKGWRIGLGIGAGAFATLAVTATAVANGAATEWAAQCSAVKP